MIKGNLLPRNLFFLYIYIHVVIALHGDGQADIFTGIAGIVCGVSLQRIS